LRAAPGVNSVSGTVALWGLGGTQESGATNFTVGSDWMLVTAPLDVQNPGHTSLRAEIYMQTTGANLDADGALLISPYLNNASFESSSAGWFANNLASAVNFQQYNPGNYGTNYAHDGSGFLEMNTSTPGGSVAQDVPGYYPQPGESYSFSVWLRAAPGVNSVSGTVALWGLGGAQESGATNFTVGSDWMLVTAPLDVQNPGHTSLRAEIYMQTTGANLDADGATLRVGAVQPVPYPKNSVAYLRRSSVAALCQEQPPKSGPRGRYVTSGTNPQHLRQTPGSRPRRAERRISRL
jgi:hypothetical protein